MAGFISFFSCSRIKICDSLLLSTQWFFLSIILLDFIEDFPVTNHKYVQCFEVRWHACILTWFEIQVPPSLMLHHHRVPLFAFQSLLCSSVYWLIRVLAIHSVVSAVSILGYPRRLLLSLFIKLDNAPKYGIAWFIMKDFISWFLPRIVLWLIVCIVPTPIKMVNQSWICL